MSRRHKTPEELAHIQSRQGRPQGGGSLKITPGHNDSESNHFESFDLVARKTDGTTVVFSSKEIFSTLAFVERHVCLWHEDFSEHQFMYELERLVLPPEEEGAMNVVQFALEEYLRSRGEECPHKPGRRGKRTVERLLSGYRNDDVCNWFDRVRTSLKRCVSSLKQLVCSFFCALFDTVKSEEPYQKETCYYKIIRSHLEEKIPCLRTIQNGIKWFWGWKKSVLPWKDEAREARKHSAWERLYRLIMGELPRLEPQLAMC